VQKQALTPRSSEPYLYFNPPCRFDGRARSRRKAASAFSGVEMAQRAYVYVDGFNLYNRCLKKTPYKWLDLVALARVMLPGARIVKVKYFTARISARPANPNQVIRQQAYLSALTTLPEIEIYFGHFMSHATLAVNLDPPPRWVRYMKTEEKGSDVNIATQLLCDAYEEKFDIAGIISSDFDLVMPIDVVARRLHLPVGVLSPRIPVPVKLRETASFVKVIRPGALGASQLPGVISHDTGVLVKPHGW
jgi:hypothetical protein